MQFQHIFNAQYIHHVVIIWLGRHFVFSRFCIFHSIWHADMQSTPYIHIHRWDYTAFSLIASHSFRTFRNDFCYLPHQYRLSWSHRKFHSIGQIRSNVDLCSNLRCTWNSKMVLSSVDFVWNEFDCVLEATFDQSTEMATVCGTIMLHRLMTFVVWRMALNWAHFKVESVLNIGYR